MIGEARGEGGAEAEEERADGEKGGIPKFRIQERPTGQGRQQGQAAHLGISKFEKKP